MTELKPEDVYKWLDEIANNENLKQCSGIPSTAEAALALLREKDADIKRRDAKIDTLQKQVRQYGAEIGRKDAEIERLEKDREELIVTLKMNDAPFPEGLQIVHDFCEKRKMKAITEFAERLKSEVNGGQFASYKGLEIRNVIDQIEKEMKEGKR